MWPPEEPSCSLLPIRMPPAVRRCTECGRPTALYPNIGWLGWCGVCNWHWLYKDGLIYYFWFRWMHAKSSHLGGCAGILRNVGSFLVDEALLTSLRTGLAHNRLREMQLFAARRRWRRILAYVGCRGPQIRDEHTGEIRRPDSNDVDDEGILLAHLNFVNWFWKLQLNKGRHEPLVIISDFLANVPLP